MFRFHHISLSVSNADKSAGFYSVFGFKKVFEWVADDGSLRIVHLKLSDSLMELFCFKEPVRAPASMRDLETDLPVIGVRHFGLKTDSIVEARDALVRLG